MNGMNLHKVVGTPVGRKVYVYSKDTQFNGRFYYMLTPGRGLSQPRRTVPTTTMCGNFAAGRAI